MAPFAQIREWKNFDANTGKDSAREIREYFIPDFSNWKDYDSYQKAFERLVRDLKAPEKDRRATRRQGRFLIWKIFAPGRLSGPVVAAVIRVVTGRFEN